MKLVLSEEQIKELIKKPLSRPILEKAAKQEQKLRQYYDNSFKEEVIYNNVSPLLTSQKFSKFKIVFKNHPQTLVNRIERHYHKVFTARGKSFSFDFGNDQDAESDFISKTRNMFEGMDGSQFFRDKGSKLAITQPNSVYLLGSKIDEVGEEIVIVKHVKLKNIHDIMADVRGIRYVIFKFEEKINGKQVDKFWVYDDLFYSAWIKDANGLHLDNDITPTLILHNNSVCPVTWVYDDNENTQEEISKKSILTDSLKDFLEYSIMKTFYTNYKYFGAFGKDFEPETRCDFKDTTNNVQCNGSGILLRIDQDKIFSFPGNVAACPNCQGKNDAVMGKVVKIPIQQQSNEVLISNYRNMNFRIEADHNLLTFHNGDIAELKKQILIDVIGEGFGQMNNNQAINQTQVVANFDDQESNLNFYGSKIEKAWDFLLTRAAELIAPESFNTLSVRLGKQYFLKTTGQIQDELKGLYEGTNNDALINQKQVELLLTDNKNGNDMLKRYELVRVLKPFSSYPLSYITENRANLQLLYPNRIMLFDNFDTILARFEVKFGKLETLFIDTFNSDLVIKNMIAKFNDILQDINTQNNDISRRNITEGGQG